VCVPWLRAIAVRALTNWNVGRIFAPIKDLTQGSVTCLRQGFGMAGLAVLNTRAAFLLRPAYCD
jgi:hypothetical protein